MPLIMGMAIGCSGQQTTTARNVTFDELFANPGHYNGRCVIVEGFYFHGFEVIVLSEGLEYSGYAEGHLVPKGRMIWISEGIPKEVYDELYQQQMMGHLERYGKVRVTGLFEYGGKYGHVGMYSSQIVPVELELLPGSPTAQQ